MEKAETKYIKRTQKDYPLSLKLAIVQEYEMTHISKSALMKKYGIYGKDTISFWLKKYGNFDYSNKAISQMPQKTKNQELMELREKVKFLEKQNARLEKELQDTDHKAAFFDLMIDMAEKEFKIDIRKKSLPE